MPPRLTAAALVLMVLAGLAFWPPYLSRVGEATAATHAHAILGAAWLGLLAVQPALVAAARHRAHRRLGRLGVLLGTAFVVSGVLIAQRSVARMDAEQFAREGRFVYLPLAMALIFAVTLALAIRWRASPPLHARFMAATTIPLLDPLLARILYFHGPPLPAEPLYQVPAFVLAFTVVALLARSLPQGSPGRRSVAGYGVAVGAILLGFYLVPHTAPWLGFVAWFRGVSID